MYGSKTNKEQTRKEGLAFGTLRLFPSLNKGGAEELSHAALLSKVRGMVRTWQSFTTRKELDFKLLLVLSDWSESKQCRSDLHLHFLLYCSGIATANQFFRDWWRRNGLGDYRHIIIKSQWESKVTGQQFPINIGAFNYVMANYEHSTHKNIWELNSKALENHSWLMCGVEGTVSEGVLYGF